VTIDGVSIIIPPNTLAFLDGQTPKESVQIEIREVFNKSNMILSGLGTTSNGRLLESYGMIELLATSGGKDLKIRDGGSIRVTIPNKSNSYDGELFYGQESSNILNWNYADTTKDTTVVVETLRPMSDDLASVKRTTYRFVNGLREFVSDTLFTIKYGWRGDSASADFATGFPKEYEFEVTKLGWINCDRFIEVNDKVDLEIELKAYSQPIGYLVFSDINSVMQILFDEKGKTIAKNLPNNYEVDLIVIDNIKGDIMWTKQNIKIGSATKLSLQTQKTTENELRSELKKLDR